MTMEIEEAKEALYTELEDHIQGCIGAPDSADNTALTVKVNSLIEAVKNDERNAGARSISFTYAKEDSGDTGGIKSITYTRRNDGWTWNCEVLFYDRDKPVQFGKSIDTTGADVMWQVAQSVGAVRLP